MLSYTISSEKIVIPIFHTSSELNSINSKRLKPLSSILEEPQNPMTGYCSFDSLH